MIVIRRLLWDEWNVIHIARHQVTPDEAEEVCHGDFVLLQGKKGRLILIGPTQRRRLLAVVLDPAGDEGVYYPVTARPAAKKERQLYRQQKGSTKI